MQNASSYIPLDRRIALAQTLDLPEHVSGAVLFADISGFSLLTDMLATIRGPRRGADALANYLNQVYTLLIQNVHSQGGSVIGFSGDAITCWFDAETESVSSAQRAIYASAAMQASMQQFHNIQIDKNNHVSLKIKTAIATGIAKRFLIGDPNNQVFDVLAGELLNTVAAAEQLAQPSEILADELAVQSIDTTLLQVSEWRTDPISNKRFAVLVHAADSTTADLTPAGLTPVPSPLHILPNPPELRDAQIRPWLPATVYTQLRAQQSDFLAELRPAVALFIKFSGIDFDRDKDAGSKLDAYIHWIQRILARYEATLIQVTTGDKGSYLYAACGAPIAHGDDAERAVAAALDLRTPPDSLAYITGTQIGISQGRMRVGAYGSPTRQTYGVLGDATNFAARLMIKAESGQILVSDEIAEMVRNQFQLQDMGLALFKGKEEPLPFYSVIQRRARLASQYTEIYAEPLVDRDAEIMQIEALLADLGSSTIPPHGHIVRIEGDAGVGKSHLAAAALQSADEYGYQVVIGICNSTSRDIAYYAVRQVARFLLGLPADTTPATATQLQEQIEQVTTQIEQLNPEWILRLPLLGDLLGLPIADNATTAAFDPQLRQEALTALTLELLQQSAKNQPLLLLIEDAHWMDEASQNIVLGLARTIHTAPILLLLLHRPATENRSVADRSATPLLDSQHSMDGLPRNVASQFLTELADVPHQLFLHLNELSPTGTAALVENRLYGTVSPLALSVIQAQGQGNPFFTEELVDTLQESGKLIPADGAWRLSQSMVKTLAAANLLVRHADALTLRADASIAAADLGLPDSIHGAVLSRLDRLPEAEKLTLKVAGVIGRSFEFDMLAASHPAHPDESTLLDQVARLIERGFARLETPEPQLSYTFRHNITQEVAYRTLLERQRTDLHFAVAQTLEAQQPDSIERLAHHFSNGDLTRPPVRVGALRYLGEAGDRAKRDYANETALSYYDRGLTLDPRWDWLKSKVDVLHLMGRREEEESVLNLLDAAPEADPVERALAWGEYYEATSDFAAARDVVVTAQKQAAADPAVQARCLSKLGIIAWREGDYDAAKSAYEEALALVGADPRFVAEEAELSYGLGLVYRERGEYEAARDLFERALEINRGTGNRREEARVLSALGFVEYREKDFEESIRRYMKALEIQQSIGDQSGVGATLNSVAQTESDLGDYSSAKKHLEDALTIHQSSNNKWWQAVVHSALAVVAIFVGKWDEAEAQINHGLNLCQEIGAKTGEAYMLCNLGQIQREQKRFIKAEKTLLSGLAMAQDSGDTFLEALYLGELAAINLENQRLPNAIEYSLKNLAFYAEQDSPPSVIDDITRLAIIYSQSERRTSAMQYAEQAMQLLDECEGEGVDYPHRDYFRCYKVFSLHGDTEQAMQALKSADRLLQEKAAKISDAEMRRSFLENVSFNAEILQEAERYFEGDTASGDDP